MSFTTRIKFLNNNNNSKKKKDTEMTQLKKAASPMTTNNGNNNNQPNDENPCDDVNEKYVDIDGIKFKITESEDDEGEEDGGAGGGGGVVDGDGDCDGGDQNNEDANSTTSSSHELQKIKRRKPNQDAVKNIKKTTQKPKKDQKQQQQQDKQDKSKNELMLKVNKRKVSLLKFDPNTALYPVCRAWMVNEQESKYIDLDYLFTQYVKRPENGLKLLKALIDDDISCISLMPAPISQLIEVNGACLESRIPNAEILSNQQQQQQSKKNNLDDIIKRLENNDTEDFPSTVGLLREHLQRWKSVKVNWKKHTRAYDEERYGVNFAILDTMFKLQMRKNN